jgi:hypothetical protein
MSGSPCFLALIAGLGTHINGSGAILHTPSSAWHPWSPTRTSGSLRTWGIAASASGLVMTSTTASSHALLPRRRANVQPANAAHCAQATSITNLVDRPTSRSLCMALGQVLFRKEQVIARSHIVSFKRELVQKAHAAKSAAAIRLAERLLSQHRELLTSEEIKWLESISNSRST